MKKKVNVFGKKLPVFLIALVAMGVVSAALLQYFGAITTTVNAHQSIKLLDFGMHPDDEGAWLQCNPGYGDCTIKHDLTTDFGEESPGGERFCYKHKLKNQMSVEGTISFDDKCNGYRSDDTWMNCDGITTTYYSVPMKTILVLENKNSVWDILSEDGTQATLVFDTIGNNGMFNYELEATGLQPGTSYSLIYYADRQDRFVNWGGDNPGALFGTFTSDGNGKITYSYSLDINMNLPHPDDWNGNPSPDYCGQNNGFDSYVHCAGAKIWLVPSSDYDSSSKKVNWVNAGSYLYETDLITYFDCDLPADDYLVDLIMQDLIPSVTELTIQSDEVQDFLVCYEFDMAIAPGKYEITTKILPVQPSDND